MKVRRSPFVLGIAVVAMAAFALFHFARFPLDVIQAGQLDGARVCSPGESDGCITSYNATLIGAIYHSKSAYQIDVEINGSFHTIDMSGVSWSTISSVPSDTEMTVSWWNGTWVYVDTPVGRWQTGDNPHARIRSDALIGLLSGAGFIVLIVALFGQRRVRMPVRVGMGFRTPIA